MPTSSSGAILSHRRGRIAAYALALAMLLAVTAIFTVSSWNRAVERHERDLDTRVVMGSTAVNAYLVSVEQSLADLSERLLTKEGGANAQHLLERYNKNHPEFEVVSLINVNGEAIASGLGPLPNAAQLPSFIDAKERLLKGERMAVTRPFLGRDIPKWLIHLRYGVRDEAGKVLYILGGAIPVDHAEAFWKDAPLAPGADMGLLRDDLYAIARYPVPKAIAANIYTRPQPGLLSDYLREHKFPAEGVLHGYSVAVGSQATVAFQHLKDYPIYFVSVNPQSVLIREWWSSAWPTYAALLALLLGSVSITRWIGRQQTRVQLEREARLAELEILTLELSLNKSELERTMKRLEATNAELEAYMYSASHDLRAPIRAIDGFAALLTDELAPPAESEPARLLGRIRASAKRMGVLLNDLLDLSRYSTQDLHRETLYMHTKVESILADMGSEIDGVTITIDPLPDARGDQVLMRQVWSNLIGNAIKYSAKSPNPAIHIGYTAGEYFVADNGIGFDMAYASKLFKLFSRLHGDETIYPGTGVGLVIVKRVIERHGGSIRAEGTPGAGARFSFTVPA